MHFEHDHLYHLYNRGDGKQRIFFSDDNYRFFLNKVRKEWMPFSDIIAYCLMPNHFHFILKANPRGCNYLIIKDRLSHLQFLSKNIGKTLSSYTRAINLEQNRKGNLFQKKTKAKSLTEYGQEYLINCLHYIHFNPVAAHLVSHESSWEFSSYLDYSGLRQDTLCKKELLYEIGDISEREFQQLATNWSDNSRHHSRQPGQATYKWPDQVTG